jgi:acetoin utilization deacetylase AcuC-like enzyme
MKTKTAFIYDEAYFWHDAGNGALFLPTGGWVEADTYVENPATKRRVKNLLERSGFIKQLDVVHPRAATIEEVARVHTEAYIARVKELSDTTGGDAGQLAIVGRGSYEISLLSAGGGITGVDLVMKGHADNVYAITRPPGHHATPDFGMGFCIFNNVAIAAHYARKKYKLKRILILDWDVHHGNGTETAFYNDPEVLFISLHEDKNFPHGRGLATHVGEGEGEGYTVNIPLPAGTSEVGYMHALRNIVEPIIDQYQPELILISAGQDPNFFDPLGHMLVSAQGFHQFASFAKEMAEKYCKGRMVACHEGGYSVGYTPFCTLRVIEAFKGASSGVEDPFQITIDPELTAQFPQHQKDAINEVIKVQSQYWKLTPMA